MTDNTYLKLKKYTFKEEILIIAWRWGHIWKRHKGFLNPYNDATAA